MSKFQIGDRAMLHNIRNPDDPNRSPWYNGSIGTITECHDLFAGHQPTLADGTDYNDNEGSYGIRFDGFDYGDNPKNCHTASERILTFVEDWSEEDVADLFGLTPPPPQPHCPTCTCHQEET